MYVQICVSLCCFSLGVFLLYLCRYCVCCSDCCYHQDSKFSEHQYFVSSNGFVSVLFCFVCFGSPFPSPIILSSFEDGFCFVFCICTLSKIYILSQIVELLCSGDCSDN